MFENVILLSRQRPQAYRLPSPATLASLKAGDSVKVWAKGERFWIRLTVADGPHLGGIVANHLLHPDLHGYHYGDMIDPIPASAILDIDTACRRAP